MTHEIQLQHAASELRALQAQREPMQGRVKALLGDGSGRTAGNRGVPWVFARLGGDASQLVEAYNGTPLTPVEGMAVTLLVKYQEGRVAFYEVERLANDVPYVGYIPGQSGGTAAHHLSHEFVTGGGWDGVNVYERAFTSLRVNAQLAPDLTVRVAPGYYSIDGSQYYYAGGNSPTMVAPGSGLEYDVVCIDATGTISIEAGALTYPPAVFTFSTSGLMPLAAIQLLPAQTMITELDIIDVRPFLSISTGSSGTGQILEDSNGDSLLDSNSNVILT